MVSDVHDIGRLTIANNNMDMSYETALQVSGWLRMHAKRAKHNAGDFSRKWRVLGILDGLKE